MLQKISICVLLVMLCLTFNLSFGQNRGPNAFKYELCFKQVSFGGTLNSNYIKIKKDDSSDDFFSPHFINGTCNKTSDEVKPVAYVAGTQPRVTSILELDCTGEPVWVSAKVETSNTDVLTHFYPALKISAMSGSNEYIYKNGLLDYVSAVDGTGTIFTFEINKTLYIEEYKIQWRISPNSSEAPDINDDTKWEIVGESKNTVYVTYSLPILSLTNGHQEETKALYTLLHIGCTNADKNTDQNSIVNNVYNEFKDNKVYRADNGGPIEYWGLTNPLTPQPGCWQPSQMLITLDGRCGGWAALFEDIIRLQGIASSSFAEVNPNSNFYTNLMSDAMTFFGPDFDYINFVPIQGDIQNHPQFYVKNWNLNSEHKFFVNEFFNKINTLPQTTFNVNGNPIPVLGLIGAEGQGNRNPRSEFENHAIVKFEGKYYDPSYGTGPYEDDNAWEDSSLMAFGSLIFYEKPILIGTGLFFRRFVNHKAELNTTAPQVIINP